MNNRPALLILALLSVLFSCNQAGKNEKAMPAQAGSFVKAPIPRADVPYKEYAVDAAKGDTLFFETGSIILFPPDAFVDKSGNVISGMVQVKYREFTSPIDFYLSGIPMNYDSAGTAYNFESSGMCEVLAYKDGVPVYVNPKSKPEVNLASNNSNTGFNLYYLDTAQKKWINKGISSATEISQAAKGKYRAAVTDGAAEPVMPEKANNKSPIIKLVVDPASFKELLAYDNLQFQLDANQSYNPNDTSDEWSNVELKEGKSKGLYIIKFSNANRTVSYNARPVLAGTDYDKALKIFEKNNAAYKKAMNERLASEQVKQKTNKKLQEKEALNNLKIDEENKKTATLNLLIEARNREIERVNTIVEKQNEDTKKRKAAIRETMLADSLIREFSIDGFGVWNCDQPVPPNYHLITANFTDNIGNHLALTNNAVIYRSLNSIFRSLNQKLEVADYTDNMIIGVYNGRFAYITNEDYGKLKITAGTKEQTFMMTVVDEKDNNYDFIKKISRR